MKRKLKNEVKEWLIVVALVMFWIIWYIVLDLFIFADADAKIVDKTEIVLLKEDKEPCSTSSFKSYMDYRSITSEESEQYKFIQEHMHIKDGYLLDEQGYIGVALGSEFGDIGSRYVFILDTGIEIQVVKIEVKDDLHTINGCEHKIDRSVIEFVIDENYFVKGSNGYILNGNFNNNEWFNGNIESYRKVN